MQVWLYRAEQTYSIFLVYPLLMQGYLIIYHYFIYLFILIKMCPLWTLKWSQYVFLLLSFFQFPNVVLIYLYLERSFSLFLVFWVFFFFFLKMFKIIASICCVFATVIMTRNFLSSHTLCVCVCACVRMRVCVLWFNLCCQRWRDVCLALFVVLSVTSSHVLHLTVSVSPSPR